jgi:predicted transcriptional regulator
MEQVETNRDEEFEMSKPLMVDLSNEQEICSIGKALSSPVRVDILKLLYSESLSIVEISEKLSIAPSSAALHVRMLETAGLINAEVQPGTRGAIQLCSRKKDSITIDLTDLARYVHEVAIVDMPVGAYTSVEVRPTCGIADEDGPIGNEDSTSCFYLPEHYRAQLIWSAGGYVEYHFPNTLLQHSTVKNVSFSMEICSEAANYREDWPSEITAWINGIDCGTYLSPGDFGARRGRYTPMIWSSGSTQYGLLTTWSVRKNGCYINEEKVSDVTIEQLNIQFDKPISLRIGNKPDAQYVGGFNIFGEKYGDHQQNIIMSLEY